MYFRLVEIPVDCTAPILPPITQSKFIGKNNNKKNTDRNSMSPLINWKPLNSVILSF